MFILQQSNLTEMTNTYSFLPMSSVRNIVFVIYEQFELLDLSGPSSVFHMANKVAGKAVYTICAASCSGGEVESRSGINVSAEPLKDSQLSSTDTVLIVGGDPSAITTASRNPNLKQWLQSQSKRADRIGSICSGALILAAAGLLDDKKATTHWSDLRALKGDYPQIKVEQDALYTVDGNIWTSAGVTTGIDMALAMVARDLGNAIMRDVAKWLVLYVHRPGNQSQYSQLTDAQAKLDTALADVVPWLDEHMHLPIKVSDMADRCAMSERSFHRKFVESLGTTPAKFLATRRLYHAKHLIESGVALKTVVNKVGYQSELGFRSAFEALYGISPATYKRMHCNRSN